MSLTPLPSAYCIVLTVCKRLVRMITAKMNTTVVRGVPPEGRLD